MLRAQVTLRSAQCPNEWVTSSLRSNSVHEEASSLGGIAEVWWVSSNVVQGTGCGLVVWRAERWSILSLHHPLIELHASTKVKHIQVRAAEALDVTNVDP